jgi:disulfide oxidoreductase YuzD
MAQDKEELPGVKQSNEWAKDVFKREYKKHIYKPFEGKIEIVGKGAVLFNGDLLNLKSSDDQYLYLLEHGILHSGLFGGG